ncbi:hypothetical protein PEL8287_02933 [Roseovarius litorisediminis]|uniref:Uncharacterized protein n=1 Tax=Roseovarius litorisediminis TaxID=1312363 RepID=A0A1Y5T355_9RHOB|nr:hypothetical protein [Roseovarius litorisediminis]SLN54699.1 hypothetical protein PEL8287_02933 [Roseovarius litorisediminis]
MATAFSGPAVVQSFDFDQKVAPFISYKQHVEQGFEEEKVSVKRASSDVLRELFRLFGVALRCLFIAAFSITLTGPIAAQSLKEQLDKIQEVLPGNSYTKYSPALAVQSWEMAATVAHIQKPMSCKTAKIIDTKVTAVKEKVIFTSKRKLKQGHWLEIWTFDKCGKRVRVQAEFRADGKGTADGDFSVAK